MAVTANDPALRSFVEVPPDGDFPIQNLPFGIFRERGQSSPPRVGVAIGEQVLDLAEIAARGLFDRSEIADAAAVFSQGTLNRFLALGRRAWRSARTTVSALLRVDEGTLRDDPALRRRCLQRQDKVEMLLPAAAGDYTDFYSSRHHAANVGTMLRGADHALQPNWLHLPVAYHGRASSIVVSGTPVRRPAGQTRADEGQPPAFGPSRMLDFELEMGAMIGTGNALGSPIAVGEAGENLFGLVLLNDWSARDIQKWEYVPLGPFLAKNFATTISPWVVTFDALEPFRVRLPEQDPPPLPYLREVQHFGYDIHLEVWLKGAADAQAERISASNARHLYWSFAQQVAHHTSGGCNLRPGDLLGTGTISGPAPGSYGSLLELTWGGKNPLRLADGRERRSLHDGDTVTLTGWAQGKGYRIGFGACAGNVLPALP
jgi:fumarylacetoacetase